MAKFFVLLILPIGTDVTDSEAVERVALEMMTPFRMREDEVPTRGGYWDYFFCCTKKWMDDSQLSYSEYAVSAEQSLVLFPAEQLGPDGVANVIVTPKGEWHGSAATYTTSDSGWEARALEIFHSYRGHSAVLAYCHG